MTIGTARDVSVSQDVNTTNNNTTNNNTTNNNTTNNTTNHITIVNDFGKEDVRYLGTSFLRWCFLNRLTGYRELIQRVHFDPLHPENHNVRLHSRCSRGNPMFMRVLVDGREHVRATEEVLQQLRAHASVIIDEFAMNNRELFKQEVEETIDYWLQLGQPDFDSKQEKRAKKLIVALFMTNLMLDDDRDGGDPASTE